MGRYILVGLLCYVFANIAIFIAAPGRSPWHYYTHDPQPLAVEHPGDASLSLEEISNILDEIDLAYGARTPSTTENANGKILNVLYTAFYPAWFALGISEFIGYIGPATDQQAAFTRSVKNRYNYLAEVGLRKGMTRDGYLFAIDARITKQNGMSFQELRNRLQNPDYPYMDNISFEEPSFSQDGYGYLVPGWFSNAEAENATFVERIDGFAAEGRQHLGMERGVSVHQDLTATYKENMVYTLSVSVGNRPAWTSTGNRSSVSLTTPDEEMAVTEELDASTLSPGAFGEISLLIDTSVVAELVGEPIRVRLSADGEGRSHFDYVRLDEIPK
jgi:hypothetical protein